MHRDILGMDIADPKQVDHRDNNGLNNQKKNLRICTKSINLRNRKPYGKTSKHKGVYWNKKAKKWYSQITLPDGHKKYLGSFLCEKEAAEIYRKYANPKI